MQGFSALAQSGSPVRSVTAPLVLTAALVLTTACGDPVAPSAPVPDGPSAAVLENRTNLPGILFGSFSMGNAYLNGVHTGWMQGGAVTPKNILSLLSGARAKRGRVVMKLSMGKDKYVKNADGTFSLTKWKELVDRFKDINIDPYINDGTLVGHYLIDEPHRAARWGGKPISHQTLEEMAKHSKQRWPNMTTFVRVVPSWLASGPITYTHVDAGWTQYTTGKGDPAKWVAAEAAAARRAGLGLVVGMNVLNGGNGSSKIRGRTSGKWAMSAAEIRSYGSAMLAESHACAFVMWTHDVDYYERSDIKSAMTEISKKATAHAKTSCRQ